MSETQKLDSESYIPHEHEKNVIRLKMKLAAEPLLGVPYRSAHNQEEETEGIGIWKDLSTLPFSLSAPGLVMGICRKVGLRLPATVKEQYAYTVENPAPRAGDFAFLGYEKDPEKVYHVGMIFDDYLLVETSAKQVMSKYETGRVVLHTRYLWEKSPDFLGYRAHPKLI